MKREAFLDRVTERLGLTGSDAAEDITRAVLSTLGELLQRPTAEALAEELPQGLGESLLGDLHGQSLELDGLYAKVAARQEVRLSIAVEQVTGVGRTVAEAVREDVIARVRRELSEGMASILSAPEPLPPPPPHLDRERRTLAEGAPGGTRPLYSAGADRAHSESVARSDQPHADTKLSSAKGLTQERNEETLATGRPGSSRPLSEGE